MRTYRAICPVCKKETSYPDNPAFPFCSERCRLIDLGDWLEGKYVIPGEPVTPSLEGQEEGPEGKPAGEGKEGEADDRACGR